MTACFTLAYVEGRDEPDRGTSSQPLTQVSKLMRSFRKLNVVKFGKPHNRVFL